MHTIPPSQSSILPGIYIAVLMSALITMIVEVALSLRIYRACQRPWNIIGIVVSGLAVVRCGAAIVLVGKLFSDDNFDQSIGSMGGLVTGLLTTSAAIDIIIAVSLLKFLLVKRSTPLARYASFLHKMSYTQHVVSARRILDRLILITLSVLFHPSSQLELTKPMDRERTPHQHHSGRRPHRLSDQLIFMYDFTHWSFLPAYSYLLSCLASDLR